MEEKILRHNKQVQFVCQRQRGVSNSCPNYYYARFRYCSETNAQLFATVPPYMYIPYITSAGAHKAGQARGRFAAGFSGKLAAILAGCECERAWRRAIAIV